MKTVYKYLILLSIVQPLFAQTIELSPEAKYYLTPAIGTTIIEENDGKGDKNVFSFGLAISQQEWPFMVTFSGQINNDFGIGGENVTKNYISTIREVNLVYYYLFRVSLWEDLVCAPGAGLALVNIVKNGNNVSEESPRQQYIKMGFPIHAKFAFMSEDEEMSTTSLTLFTNFNSESLYWGLKLEFNIGLAIDN